MTARRQCLAASAIIISAIGVAMAAASAVERGATAADQTLLVSMAATLTLGAHLLPALCRRRPACWALWAGLMVCVVYGHAVFFSAAAHRAGLSRAASVAPTHQASALGAELAALQARPLATVAADLARAAAAQARAAQSLGDCQRRTPGQCAARSLAVQQTTAARNALDTEHRESERAMTLRSQITAAAGALDSQQDQAALDPIGAQAAKLAGLSADTVQLIVSVASAALLELLAALLWSELMARPQAATTRPRISWSRRALPQPAATATAGRPTPPATGAATHSRPRVRAGSQPYSPAAHASAPAYPSTHTA